MTRVAIVGGGLGGLATAAFLHQAGVQAVVYEQARELREVGAGIMVPPNAARMLRRLGVLDTFSERAVQLDIGWEFRRWRDGTVLSAQDLTAKSARLYGEHTYTVHRADLLEAVKSAVPVSGGELVNVVAIAPAGDYATESWKATATVEEFLAEFDGWDGRLTSLIKVARTPGRWALLIRQPLPRWTWGPVTLLGDAAHPMLPFLGQGAAQAFEDAAMLATCLANGKVDPAGALRRYESARIDRASRVQQGSHARADFNHLPDGPEQRDRDTALRAADPLAANAWIYAHDPFSPN